MTSNAESVGHRRWVRWVFSVTPKTTKKPTDTIPGTWDRVQVYARRIEDGEHIFDDRDRKDTDDDHLWGDRRLFE